MREPVIIRYSRALLWHYGCVVPGISSQVWGWDSDVSAAAKLSRILTGLQAVRHQTEDLSADEFLPAIFSSLKVVPEVETSDPTECEFVDSHTGYGWDPSTMLSGTAFHPPNRPNARHYQGLLGRCRGNYTASLHCYWWLE